MLPLLPELIGLVFCVPVFCSVMGVVARGTVFMSKGFSVGSKVYWWRDFSRPGMETDKPESNVKKKGN